MLKKIFIITILLPCFVSLSGCLNQSDNNGNPEEMILGVWKRMNYDSDQTWEFKQSGIVILSTSNLTITYWFENNSLFTSFIDIGFWNEYTYQFNGNDELKLNMIESNELLIDPVTGDPIPFQPMEILFQRVNE